MTVFLGTQKLHVHALLAFQPKNQLVHEQRATLCEVAPAANNARASMATTTCPVFRPTEEEFSNFGAFIASIDHIAGPVGLCKVIPPAGEPYLSTEALSWPFNPPSCTSEHLQARSPHAL
jgi:jmjN domain